jgi:hypothetical protein
MIIREPGQRERVRNQDWEKYPTTKADKSEKNLR